MTVIETSFKPVWPTPVRIRTGDDFSEQVMGPEEALYHLAYSWPNTEGTEFQLAWLSCARVLKRQGRCGDAREAFVTAALEAQILVL